MRRKLSVLAIMLCAPAVVMCATTQEIGDPNELDLPPNEPPAPPLVETDGGGPLVNPDGGQPCTGLQCNVPTCAEGTTTTISGTVYAPNGRLPLPNVVVYIPNGPVAALPRGATCDRCGTLVTGNPMAAAITDTKGNFVLKDVPAGQDIPLVMQIGKWRREIKLPTVEACKDNLADPSDTGTDPSTKYSLITRLPRNQQEGSLPKIAITTGGCDQIACLIPKLGIEASEIGGGFSAKAVNFYGGATGQGPSNPPKANTALWNDINKLKQYDVVIHSCECDEHNQNKGGPVWGAMKEYVDMGGRLFTTDYGYTFIEDAPAPWSQVATWATDHDGGFPPYTPGGNYPINKGFPKGKALAEWLDYTNGTTSSGMVNLPEVFNNAVAVDPKHATPWVTELADAGGAPKIFTFNSPVGVDEDKQCGRVAFGDAHIFTQMENNVGTNFPAGCRELMSDREKVIAFLFFDLTACVISDLIPPEAPPIVK